MFRFFTGIFMGIATLFSGITSQTASLISHTSSSTSQQVILTNTQLLELASDKYADGILPLGDNKYVTETPQKGSIYLCHANADPSGGGAKTKGSWIHGGTWNIKEKLSVTGSVLWKNARFSQMLVGTTRTLAGNDLPSHATGIFPIALSDPAHQYDQNPNSIQTQSFTDALPTHPTYSDTPYCMGGEVGVMLTGVALFNGFDAELRDAAYEVQDSCQGHPQVTGEYHYHNLSRCITDVSETTVIGYALDGFPITGPKMADKKYLTTENLDECHGITSDIYLDGKKTTLYHYVMTEDFPYSVSCFRGKPVTLQVISNSQKGTQPNTQQKGSLPNPTLRPSAPAARGILQQPPQVAITSCSGKSTGATCSFLLPNDTVSGTCQIPPNQTSLVCVPAQPPAR